LRTKQKKAGLPLAFEPFLQRGPREKNNRKKRGPFLNAPSKEEEFPWSVRRDQLPAKALGGMGENRTKVIEPIEHAHWQRKKITWYPWEDIVLRLQKSLSQREKKAAAIKNVRHHSPPSKREAAEQTGSASTQTKEGDLIDVGLHKGSVDGARLSGGRIASHSKLGFSEEIGRRLQYPKLLCPTGGGGGQEKKKTGLFLGEEQVSTSLGDDNKMCPGERAGQLSSIGNPLWSITTRGG